MAPCEVVAGSTRPADAQHAPGVLRGAGGEGGGIAAAAAHALLSRGWLLFVWLRGLAGWVGWQGVAAWRCLTPLHHHTARRGRLRHGAHATDHATHPRSCPTFAARRARRRDACTCIGWPPRTCTATTTACRAAPCWTSRHRRSRLRSTAPTRWTAAPTFPRQARQPAWKSER